MQQIIHFEPITPSTYQEFIDVGTKAYNQHYLHLWPNGDSTPYISSSFTLDVLEKEALDKNTLLYIIKQNQKSVGILKFTLNSELKEFNAEEALYVDKIYIQNEYSGKGIGKKVIQFVLLRAQEIEKKIVWLDTMQKGAALHFYLKNGFENFGETEVQLPTVLHEEKQMYIMVKRLLE